MNTFGKLVVLAVAVGVVGQVVMSVSDYMRPAPKVIPRK